MIKRLTIFCLVLWCPVVFAQTTYTITANTVNTATGGELDDVIPLAITAANAGNTVVVYFNVTTVSQSSNTYVQLSSALPALNGITSGSITFTKQPSASTPQGIQFTGSLSDAAFINCFSASSNTSSSLTFSSLNFLGFQNSGSITRSVIQGNTVTNLTVNGCGFTDNGASCDINVCQNFTFTNNTGTVTQTSAGSNTLKIADNTSKSSAHTITITNNTFAIGVSNPGDLGYAISIQVGLISVSTTNTTISISHNIIQDYYKGVKLDNDFDSDGNDLVATILNNAITYSGSAINGNPGQGITIKNPKASWTIDQNYVSGLDRSMALTATNNTNTTPYTCAGCGVELISTNTLGYTIHNSENVMNSVYLFNPFGQGAKVVGLTNNSNFKVYHVNGAYSIIRQNLMANPYPIQLNDNGTGAGNNGISAPSISSAYVHGGDLYITMTIPNQSSAELNYVVDVYVPAAGNMNSSMGTYLGSYTISSLSSSYSFNFTYPNSVPLVSGSRIVCTVTSLGNTGATVSGTSETMSYVLQTNPNPCPTANITASGTSSTGNPPFCLENPVTLTFSGTGVSNGNLQWNLGDGMSATQAYSGSAVNQVHTYYGTSTFPVSVTYPSLNANCVNVVTLNLGITNCTGSTECDDCIGSFAPAPGEYVISFWMREDQANYQTSYASGVKVECLDASNFDLAALPVFTGAVTPAYKIIDGWQKVEQRFTIPPGTVQLKVTLQNTSSPAADAYFDDIRIHPVNSSFKSYVYDPITMRLMAELDENNYATFYEYDEDGALIRVKKETDRGIKTIKEARNNVKK